MVNFMKNIHSRPAPEQTGEAQPQPCYVDIRLEEDFRPALSQPHSSACLLVLLIREGQGSYLFDKHRVWVRAGDFLLIMPGVSHRMEHPKPSDVPMSRIALQISPEALSILEEFRRISLGRIPKDRFYLLSTTDTQYEYLRSFCEKILEEARKRKLGWESILYGNVFTLMGLLLRALYEETSGVFERDDLLEQVIHYVGSNLNRKITLADTAHRFLVSESYISKLFRSHMNTSFYHYVIRRRLMASAEMIADGTPLEQIHSQVGFSDHAAFYRAFRSEYGVSPSQYRAGLKSE